MTTLVGGGRRASAALSQGSRFVVVPEALCERGGGRFFQRGSVLIEAMVSLVLIMLLVSLVNRLMDIIDTYFESIATRQAAVIRLNGEMERLVPRYLKVGLGPGEQFVDYSVSQPARRTAYLATNTPGTTRQIYPPDDTLVVGLADFMQEVDQTQYEAGNNINKIYDAVYYYRKEGVGSSVADRNFVWLDRDRGLVGEISWDLADLSVEIQTGGGALAANGATCGGGQPCSLLTVYLDYPFRMASDGTVEDFTDVETLTLQTIVGYR